MHSHPIPTGFVNYCRVLLTLIMRGLACTATATTGMVSVALGGLKLSKLPGDWNQQMRSMFREFAKVTPLKPFGIVPDADLYMEVVGVTEITLGGMLIFGNRRVQRYACMGLMGMSLAGAQTLISVGRHTAAFVPLSMLGLLVLVYTISLEDEEPKTK